MKYAILLSLLLFEPIVIDEQLYTQIIQGSHTNMRGPEYDYLHTLMQTLEQRAVQAKKDMIQPDQK